MEATNQIPAQDHIARCLKCKQSGPFENPVVSQSKNNRQRVSGNCMTCKGAVSTFAKNPLGSSAPKKGK